MNEAELGAKCLLSCGLINQAVVPATGFPSASVQSKEAPPQAWTSIPRCFLYQACRAGASWALKKMPPMPVTRFMETSEVGWGLMGSGVSAAQSPAKTSSAVEAVAAGVRRRRKATGSPRFFDRRIAVEHRAAEKTGARGACARG